MLHRTLDLNVLFGITNTIKNSYVILNFEVMSLYGLYSVQKEAEWENAERIHQAKHRKQRHSLVKTIMNLLVPFIN